MKRYAWIAVVVLFATGMAAQTKPAKNDLQIRQEIIAQSIASYAGSCPCPSSTDRAGRRCGAGSAYSRPGGKSPLCFEGDVTAKMIEDYRRRTKQPAAKQEPVVKAGAK